MERLVFVWYLFACFVISAFLVNNFFIPPNFLLISLLLPLFHSHSYFDLVNPTEMEFAMRRRRICILSGG